MLAVRETAAVQVASDKSNSYMDDTVSIKTCGGELQANYLCHLWLIDMV